MRLTVRTNLAMRALMYCAVHPGEYVRKGDVARACHASENHLAQVINTLAHDGFITTVRGRRGGIRLSGDPCDITLGSVFRSLESGVPFTECFTKETNTCPLTPFCRLRGALVGAVEQFYAALDKLTLHDMIDGNEALISFMEGQYTPDPDACAAQPLIQSPAPLAPPTAAE